ncbi:protein JINGUBANG-like [Neltuma alba]|uniref:protein JINGUBANG-like n=1 Tax=Neltuma alba TaxID=207710 RepID=UPI0010A582C6|nr:protein JINGUBANG-like [Prosopis alba]
MRIPSWLDSCSSTAATALQSTKKPPIPSDDTSSSDSPSSTSRDTACTSTTSSLHSNLSVQTHPSVPSLQKLPSRGTTYVVSQHCLASLNPHPSHPLTCLAIHGDLLYAASSHHITVYDRRSCTHLRSFGSQRSSSGSTKALAFCNGKVFTTHQDSKIRVWKLLEDKGYQMVTALPTVNDRLRRFLLPKNYVAVRRHRKQLWIQHADAVTGLAVNNNIIYSVSWDKSMKIWLACDLRCVESVKAHEDAVNAVVVSKDGTVYTGSADKRIRVWSKQDGEKRHALIATLEKHKSAINALALNEEGSVLFSGACDRSILVWEREHSANHMVVSGALRGHEKAILCLINVCDLLLSGSADRTVRIWKQGVQGSYCCVAVLMGHQKPVKSLAAVTESEGSEPNSDVSVFSGSLDGEIRVWRVSLKEDVDATSTTLPVGTDDRRR